MAAFGAASALAAEGVRPTTYDKNPYVGGHTATFITENGFVFDEGPHLSFTRNERIQQMLADHVEQRFEVVDARIDNYWHGHWMPHPVQCNLYGLPPELVTRIVCDFVEAQNQPERPVRHYADWLEAAYGSTFARTFPMVYGLKYHTTAAENMTTDWLGPRMYRPDLEEVLRGALSSTPRTDMHYVTTFRYPTRGGFAAYLKPFAEWAELRLCHRLVRLDTQQRTLCFDNGAAASYDRVISSVPLPDLVECIVDVPRMCARRHGGSASPASFSSISRSIARTSRTRTSGTSMIRRSFFHASAFRTCSRRTMRRPAQAAFRSRCTFPTSIDP
jgi:protoporphyrinogen oxidase